MKQRLLQKTDSMLEVLKVRAIVLIILGLSVVPTCAQTASEVERSYGKPVSVDSDVSVYSVSEHIWMKPDYAADGQVCRMRLYPKRPGEKTDSRSSQLLFPELVQFLNRMIPPHLRGSKRDGFGETTLGGGTAWTTYDYEDVSFSFIFVYKLAPDILKKAETAVLTGPDPEGLPVRKKAPPSASDFDSSEKLPTEVVTIRWNHRACKTP